MFGQWDITADETEPLFTFYELPKGIRSKLIDRYLKMWYHGTDDRPTRSEVADYLASYEYLYYFDGKKWSCSVEYAWHTEPC